MRTDSQTPPGCIHGDGGGAHGLLRGILIAVVLLVMLPPAFGQREETPTEELEALRQKAGRTPSATTQFQLMAFENTIDPDNYHIGPSDVFAVNIWGMPTVSYVLPVSPEGTLTVPTVGEIRISDLTLTQSKEKVVAAVRKRFPRAEITVTLTIPRPIVVIVTGNVLYPGAYTLTAINRAQQAVEEANKALKADPRLDYRRFMESMSTRNVVLKRKDGSLARVDIPKFLATRDDRWNPFLREGDVVIVPRKDETRNVIGIYGEVNLPGRYEYVAGDSLKDVLTLALGFTRRARADSVEFVRMDSTRSSLSSTFLNADMVLQGRVADVALEPGDRIIVRGTPDWRNDDRATIVGELRYPGTYPILRGSTRLSTLVSAAGGFTGKESLHRAYISRRPLTTGDYLIDSLMSLRGRSWHSDDGFFQNETLLRLRREIVSVDFGEALAGAGTPADVLIQPEDTVFVPTRSSSVYVYGEVIQPGHVAYVPGQNTEYYIAQAGGMLDLAYEEGIKIVKGGTKQWLDPAETTIQEGDYVWVPKEQDRPFGYYLGIVGQSAAVISVAISTIVLVLQLSQ